VKVKTRLQKRELSRMARQHKGNVKRVTLELIEHDEVKFVSIKDTGLGEVLVPLEDVREFLHLVDA
jgi:hypothetical protein